MHLMRKAMRSQMKSRVYLVLGVVIALIAGCATEVIKKPLTITEQIQVDTKSAEGLATEFKQSTRFVSLPKAQSFLNQMAQKLVQKREGFEKENVEIKIHDDTQPKYQRFFSFPGMTLSLPLSFLKKVEFENELAAAMAFEIANVMDRFLAEKVEAELNSSQKPQLFGQGSVFDLSGKERVISIKLATSLMYDARYDTRGMASIFNRYSVYYMQQTSSDLIQKEVDFNVREAQRAKSEFLPQMKPIVRSGEFIQFKKELLKKHP